jgi:alpha-D-ribose 1-methylphosphonate 5-phosphate C-P lyase
VQLGDLGLQKWQLAEARVKYLVMHEDEIRKANPERQKDKQVTNLEEYEKVHAKLYEDSDKVLYRVH